MAQKKYVCKVCGYVHYGDKAPDICPQCLQPNAFEEEKKGLKLSTDSNLYTILYATVIVVIVAVLLAVVSQVLGPRQKANALLDTQKQILVALNQDVENTTNPAALYDQLIQDTAYCICCKEVKAIAATLDTTLSQEMFQAALEAKIQEVAAPIYMAKVDGQTIYVLKLRGQGLWGAIWGYVALQDDKSTIFGINFGHESETPGLGGEIVTENFRNRFIGKHVLDASGNLRSVAVLKVGKQAEEGQEQVDAWAGATITSTGVNDMLLTSLNQYERFFRQSGHCGNCEKKDSENQEGK